MKNDWYIVRTKPKQEQKAALNIGLAGLNTFLPKIEGVRGPKPLFPSYIFVQGNLLNPQLQRLVRYTRGVQLILGDGERPCAIAEEVVETLKRHTRESAIVEQELLFKAGEKVRVKRGLLKDLIGIVEKHLPAQKRIQILFKWWSTSLRAALPCTALETTT